MMAVNADTFDPAHERELIEARSRGVRDLTGREAFGRIAMLGIFIVGATAILLLTHSDRQFHPWLLVAFVAAYGVVSSVGIEVGSGLALPTELGLVPMLFVLPANVVPWVVACWPSLLGSLSASGKVSLERVAVLPGNAFFSFGPTLVFLFAQEPSADWRGGAIVAAAVAAQFAFDFVGACLLEWLALGVQPTKLLRPLAWTFAIDAMVAPFAYGVAVADRAQRGAVLLAFPLLVLFALFARERRERLDSLLELSGAYRGTAFLLGDVVEADDAYTGDHSMQVVDLVVAVCDELGLGARDLRLAEFTALLHDIGKIRISSEIINKPARAHAGRARDHQHPHGRGRAAPGTRRRAPRRCRPSRSFVSRALGRHRLPRWSRRCRDPADLPDRLLLRRLQRDDNRPHIPTCALAAPGDRRTRRESRDPVRPGGGRRDHRHRRSLIRRQRSGSLIGLAGERPRMPRRYMCRTEGRPSKRAALDRSYAAGSVRYDLVPPLNPPPSY